MKRVLIIGGGAAGYFGAITAAENNPASQVIIAEAGSRALKKVAISGGGRCNVTHACFDSQQLVQAYPRGARELRSAFSRFDPNDTIEWFNSLGVKLKTEQDGRVFPRSDSSKTIIDCFENSRKKFNIDLRLNTKVIGLQKTKDKQLTAKFSGKPYSYSENFDAVLLACGGARGGYKLAEQLGHTIEPCVPSLFTFEIKDKRLVGLSGVSVSDAGMRLSVPGNKIFTERGPLLITHWGFSGPAVIKLSAWAARALYENNYQAELTINWLPGETKKAFFNNIDEFRQQHPKKLLRKNQAAEIPNRLWENICDASDIDQNLRYSELNRKKVNQLASQLFEGCYKLIGKGAFKEEFVTCGGVRLSEVDFRSMQSKLIPGLFFAGEILDIDGITGGYNFQSAWTTGFIAGNSI
jgi:predicted Rossmann fold flavoprotein